MSANAPEAGEALAAARRLDHTMEDLIGAARLEEGSLSPKMENLDLIDVVSAASAVLSLPRSMSLERAIAADLPFIRGDAVLLQHVLQNLLENAARHARSRIRITAELRARHVALSVSDDGAGIAAEERARIFERFARLEGSDGKRGSGLGLAIVKGSSDAMGIEVCVDEAPGGGARFTLLLAGAPASAHAGDSA
jgi:two-component system sensor histidine kinase KdpD